MKKMGLFGGSFDPIHQGHIDMALRLAESLDLDGVVLMPTFVPPHKIREQMASAEHRLEMCRLAAQEYPKLQVSDLELTRGGASFTVDTLTALHEQYPASAWYLITGADMFVTLRTWYRFEDIARMAVLCTVPREGVDGPQLEAYATELRDMGVQCYVDSQPVMTVSSTEIRDRILSGKPLDGLVPSAVADYIAENKLYQQIDGMDVRHRDEQFIEIIRTRLSEYRFRHSLSVAAEARRLAERYGADADKAYTAGILHDIMKDTDVNTQKRLFEDYNIVLDEVEQESPMLWHARSGEVFIRNILGVQDEEILSAVRYHTTGRANMSLLEKVVFVADFTSEDRDYPDVNVMRDKADQSLNEAILYGVDYTIHSLKEAGRTIHPDTLSLYDDVVLSMEERRQTNE